MVAKVGMPPNWEPIGRDKKGWVYRWRNGDSFVEHRGGSWYWYTGIKTKHFTENGATTRPSRPATNHWSFLTRCSGSSGSSSEPYPGWKLIDEGVWAKGSYVVAGGPPFLLTKKVSIIHDEIVFETLAEYPTLEAAVMFVELNYEEPERDRLTMAILRSAINHVKGV